MTTKETEPDAVAAEPEAQPRAKYLPGQEPTAKDVPFAGDPVPVVMLHRDTVGQTVLDAGAVIGKVHLATGVTLGQFLAAVIQRRAGSSRLPPVS